MCPGEAEDAAAVPVLALAQAVRSVAQREALARWLTARATAVHWADAEEWVRGRPAMPILAVRAAAEQQFASGRRAGMRLLSILSPHYPPLLRHIRDPPAALWVRGRLDALTAPAVSVVGSRAASPAALVVARRLGAGLAGCGFAVVSGLARGVDAAVHLGALDGGTTIAVLGNGLDVHYPPEHGPLADRVAEHGAVLTEFPPGTRPLPGHFPQRNRIVAGLSLGVVVVEAGETSGALITSRLALEQGREVMVVPGLTLSNRNRGGHALIKDGAALVENVEDVCHLVQGASLYRLFSRATMPIVGPSPPAGPGVAAPPDGGDGPRPSATVENGPGIALAGAAPARWGIGEELDLDTLQELTGTAPAALLSALLEGELAGQVARTPAGRFVRLR
jgi:DNA processing protein